MDPRFDTSRDPRFKRAPRQVRKVQVDGRFKRMFTDERFTETARVTPQGQRKAVGTGARNLRAFYDEAGKKGMKPRKHKKVESEENDEEDEELEEKSELESEEEAGSDSGAVASSTDIGSDDDDEDDDEDFPTVWEDPEKDVPRGDATKRLAMMGCDWDHVSAGDIMVLMRTYLDSACSISGARKKVTLNSKAPPPGATVTSVRIYPSDYGLERMAKEAESGPLIEANPKRAQAARKLKNRRGNDDDPEDDEEVDPEAIRLWEQERTKYYYGVIECNSAATACWLYDEMDGEAAQALCPGNVDLRFIPDDLKLPHAPTSEATRIPAKYRAPDLLTSGQGHTTSKCNWDEGPAHRKKDLMRKRFSEKELAEMDIKAYMDSSESEEGDADAGDLKKLIDDGLDEDSGDGENEKEFNGNMEATFNLKVDALAEDLQDRAKKQLKSSGPMKLEREGKSAWQQYLDNRKEKRKERKAEAKAKARALKNEDAEDSGNDSDMLLPTKPKDKKRRSKKDMNADDERDEDRDEPEDAVEAEAVADLRVLAMDAGETEDRGFNLRGPKRKKKGKTKQSTVDDGDSKPSSFAVDTADPRIASVFSNPDFAIDPTHTEFRSSEGMSTFLAERRKRRKLGLKDAHITDTQKAKKLLAEPVQSRIEEPELPPLKADGGLKLFTSSTKKVKKKRVTT